MVSEEPTRKMLKELRTAGWTEKRNDGRHALYGCPCGSHSVAVPASHRTISPGVVRKIRQAIASCQGVRER
jgi:predicted RNA binding protein YcfA (HicA-like mRNA interferase family)